MKYNIGDRVRYVSQYACGPYNLIGTVIGITSEEDTIPYLVEFPGFDGHTGNIGSNFSAGGCGKTENCWWCKEDALVSMMPNTFLEQYREDMGSYAPTTGIPPFCPCDAGYETNEECPHYETGEQMSCEDCWTRLMPPDHMEPPTLTNREWLNSLSDKDYAAVFFEGKCLVRLSGKEPKERYSLRQVVEEAEGRSGLWSNPFKHWLGLPQKYKVARKEKKD